MEQILRMFGVRRNNDLGFTLIELLVVIAIIGILAGVSIPLFMGQRTKAIISEAKTNLQIIHTLQEQYYAEYGRYAPWPDKSIPTGTRNTTYRGTHGNASDNGLEDFLPGFRPGDPDDLKFTYWLKGKVGAEDGTAYEMHAMEKPGTVTDGMNYTLNQNNEWGSY